MLFYFIITFSYTLKISFSVMFQFLILLEVNTVQWITWSHRVSAIKLDLHCIMENNFTSVNTFGTFP